MLSGGDPYVIVLVSTDGPQPVLLTDPGMQRPWNSYRHETAKRVCDDLAKESRIIKCQVMRAKEALRYLTLNKD